jgi:Zn-dependent protease
MIFNLLPIPPLDGSKVLYSFLDPRMAAQVRPFLDQYGIILLLIAALFPIFGGNTLLGEVYQLIVSPATTLLLGL